MLSEEAKRMIDRLPSEQPVVGSRKVVGRFTLVGVGATVEGEGDGAAMVLHYAEVHDSATVRNSMVRHFGKVFDYAVVSEGSVIGEYATVTGYARVKASSVKGTCQIHGETIVEHCDLDGNVIVSGDAHLQHVTVDHSGVNARVGGYSVLSNVVLTDNNIIVGGEIFNVTLAPHTRIHEGVWKDRPPIVIECDTFNVTECVDGKVLVGCRCEHSGVWLRGGEAIAESEGLSRDNINEIREAVEEIASIQAQRKDYEQ